MNKYLIKIIKLYQKYISKNTPAHCRHYPTCSNYAVEAFEKHNFFYAFYLTTVRILKCNPLGTYGYDPVPEPKKKKKSIITKRDTQ